MLSALTLAGTMVTYRWVDEEVASHAIGHVRT